MGAVRHRRDGDVRPGPIREERAEDLAADPAVKLADTVDEARAVQGQIGHVERSRDHPRDFCVPGT